MAEKCGHRPVQVSIREMNASEPSVTRRKATRCRRNQGRSYLLGRVRQEPDDGADGDRRRGGVNQMQAFARNCRNQSLRCEGRSTSGENREARVPMRSTGADSSVVAVKWDNATEQREGVTRVRINGSTGNRRSLLVLTEGGSLQWVTRAV